MNKSVKTAIVNTPLHRQIVVDILFILFILVFLVFNKGQRQYALQNIKHFYMSPFSVAVKLDRQTFFYSDFFSFSLQLHHNNVCAFTTRLVTYRQKIYLIKCLKMNWQNIRNHHFFWKRRIMLPQSFVILLWIQMFGGLTVFSLNVFTLHF